MRPRSALVPFVLLGIRLDDGERVTFAIVKLRFGVLVVRTFAAVRRSEHMGDDRSQLDLNRLKVTKQQEAKLLIKLVDAHDVSELGAVLAPMAVGPDAVLQGVSGDPIIVDASEDTFYLAVRIPVKADVVRGQPLSLLCQG